MRIGVFSWLSREAGLRFLARRKAACAMAVAVMALALCANTVVFSVLKAVLFSAFALPDPGRVFVIAPVRELPGQGEVIFADAYRNYRLIRETQRAFDDVACVLQIVSSWDDGERTRALPAARVSASFFSTTRVQPMLGRALRASEEGPSPARVVIIGYRVWQSMMAADPDVLGRTMVLDGEPHTIVGVMPEGFAHPLPTELWLPFDLPEQQRTAIVGGRILGVYGRLVDGVSKQAADEDAAALTRRAGQASSDNRDYRYVLRTVGQLLLPGADRTVVLVQAGALVLTLLAVLNLASLLIAWSFDRRQEMAVRLALGARSGRVMLMLVMQGMAVVAVGSVGGVALARLALPALRRLNVGPELALYLDRLHLGWGVLGWSAGVAVLAGVAAGVLPAVLGRRAAVADTLRSNPRGGSLAPAAVRWQKGMVLAQATLTVAILSIAALVGVSLRNLGEVPDGFSPGRRLVARVQLTGPAYESQEARARFADRLMTALGREAELSSFGFTSTLPVGDVPWGGRFVVELPDGSFSPDPLLLHFRRISGSYFASMGIPLLQGRTFDARDDLGQPPVAVVSLAVAERLWPGEDPVGKTVYRVAGRGEPQRLDVVGVAGNVMDGGYAAPPGEAVYVPWAQMSVPRMSIVVEPRTTRAAAVGAVRHALRAADPALAAGDVAELASLVRQANALPRLRTLLLAAFALVALGIVALGSYGLMSQLVASREREFALRLALGAATAGVGTLVLRRAGRVAVPGVILGVGLSWPLASLVRPFVFGVDAHSSLVTWVVAGCTLALIGLASVPAAVRAARVDVAGGLSA